MKNSVSKTQLGRTRRELRAAHQTSQARSVAGRHHEPGHGAGWARDVDLDSRGKRFTSSRGRTGQAVLHQEERGMVAHAGGRTRNSRRERARYLKV